MADVEVSFKATDDVSSVAARAATSIDKLIEELNALKAAGGKLDKVMTFPQFMKGRMGPAMKALGGHKAAVTALGAHYREYKSLATTALGTVAGATKGAGKATEGVSDAQAGAQSKIVGIFRTVARGLVAETKALRESNSAVRRFGTGLGASSKAAAEWRGVVEKSSKGGSKAFGSAARSAINWSGRAGAVQRQAVIQRMRETEQIRADLAQQPKLLDRVKGAFGGIFTIDLGGLLMGAVGAVGSVISSITSGVVSLGSKLLESAMSMRKSRKAFGLLLHDQELGVRTMKETMALAADLGLPIEETMHTMQKLLAMQFKPEAAKNIIKMSADLQAVGASAEQVQSVIMGMAKIKAKGRVSSEELMQMAEAGLSAELVVEALGKQLGKTTSEVQALMSAGKITAEQGIAAIGEAIKKKAGIKEFGEAARAAVTPFERLKSKLEQKWLEMADKVAPIIEAKLFPMVERFIAWLDTPAAGKFFENVIKIAETLIGLIEKLLGLLGTVATAAGGAAGGVGKLVEMSSPERIAEVIATGGWKEALKEPRKGFGLDKLIGAMGGAQVTGAFGADLIGPVETASRGFESVGGTGEALAGALKALVSAVQGAASAIASAGSQATSGAALGALGGGDLGGALGALLGGGGGRGGLGNLLGEASLGEPLVPAATATPVDQRAVGWMMSPAQASRVFNANSRATINVSGASDPAAVAEAVRAVILTEVAGAFEQLSIEVSGG